jgi:hypothetical protein
MTISFGGFASGQPARYAWIRANVADAAEGPSSQTVSVPAVTETVWVPYPVLSNPATMTTTIERVMIGGRLVGAS